MRLYEYVRLYGCEPTRSTDQLRRDLSHALNELVAEQKILNLSASCTGIRGTYTMIDPDGVQAAALAFGLTNGDMQLLTGVASKSRRR